MNGPEHISEQNQPANKKAENGKDSLTDRAMIEFAAVLDDFMDEEVVDREGNAIGTLACYWQSVSGLLVFLGIAVNGQKGVRVVPGHRSQADEEHACIRLTFHAADVASAPRLDCATDVDAALERSVYEHFGVEEAEEKMKLPPDTNEFARCVQWAVERVVRNLLRIVGRLGGGRD